MCCLIVEIIMFVLGVIGVTQGRVALTRNRVASGTPARVAGVLLLVPLPVYILANVIGGVAILGQANQQQDPALATATLVASVVAIAATVICFIAAIIICAVTAQPTSKLKARAKAAGEEQLGHFEPRESEAPHTPGPDDRIRE
jgi:hypothetical protein